MNQSVYTNNLLIITNILISIFFISTVLSIPFIIKASLYISTLISLMLLNGYRRILIDEFFNYYPYLIFVLICIFSFLYNNIDYSVSSSPQLENILAFFILFIFLLPIKSEYRKLLDMILTVTSFFLLISIPTHFFYFESSLLSGSFFFTDMENESFASKNTLAVYLVILLPYAIHKFSILKNFYNFFLIIILLLGIFYTFSRGGAILALFVILSFLLTFNKRHIYSSFIIILSIIITLMIFEVTISKYNYLKNESNKQALGFEDYNNEDINKSFTLKSERAQYILIAIEGFIDKPIFGHGLTKFKTNHPRYSNKKNGEIILGQLFKQGEIIRSPVTHNDYVQILYELGIIGILSFLFLFGFNILRLIKNYSYDREYVPIMLIQVCTLGISLNFINLLDHSIFWCIMALTTFNKKETPLAIKSFN